ncbi:MAG: transcriptional regulator, partial [Acidobacteriota bacterium]
MIYEFEGLYLDAEHLMLSRGGAEISLTPKVVETLLALVERHGEIVSKDELMDRVWENAFVEESNLIQNIYVLRKALGKTSDGQPMIETLRRRGYRFNGEVRSIEKEKRAMQTDAVSTGQQPPADIAPTKTKALPIFAIAAAAVVVVVMIGFVIARMSRRPDNVSAAGDLPSENTLKRLTPDLYTRSPVVSPDGKYLAYSQID